jgi:hypothetical protein
VILAVVGSAEVAVVEPAEVDNMVATASDSPIGHLCIRVNSFRKPLVTS